MDILYTEKTDGFVLVSSDSDFTRLAIRLREAGQRVIGIGERKTPSAFIAACDKFTYIEVIYERFSEADAIENGAQNGAQSLAGDHNDQQPHTLQRSRQQQALRPRPIKVPDEIVDLIADSVGVLAGDNGSAFMGELGNLILKKQPDFDHRNFGYKSLSAMIKSIDRFETDFRQTTDPNIKHVFVRDKES